ncbi:survival motor neuron interacting protein 1-domain-containing protein [Gigaspora rosea]|uniref:Gem-associated protein 2 n=1 Tax=Gigaspora rosea TaxID=44941 RepID=A0A397U2M2_9GLOM|nr:survival motor neuron interacting protein 1-domain-containing protein [Gigaspora rosea]
MYNTANKPPSSGEEYLRMVQMEANKIPDIFVANKPIQNNNIAINYKSNQVKLAGWAKRGWANSQSVSVEEQDKKNREIGLINEEWENAFLRRFESLRESLQRYIIKTSKGTKLSNKSSLFPPVKLPNKKDEAGWLKFCYGLEVLNHESLTTKVSENNDNENYETAAMMLPFLNIISRLNQPTTISLLFYHTKWLDGGITITKSQWLFALFVKVDKLVTPNQMAILRSVCRKCIDIRQNLDMFDVEDPILASLNMIITIVRRYFGQRDLG